MEFTSGLELLEKLKHLGINFGNIPRATFDAWCDTDCEETKQFLTWLCTSLDKNNIVTPEEDEEYNTLCERNLVLHDKEYNAALGQLQAEFPEILDVGENEFEITCLEEELKMLQKEETQLEQLLNTSEALNKKLSNKIERTIEDEIHTTIEKDSVQEECVMLTQQLEKSHERLCWQLNHYSGHLRDIQSAEPPVFLLSIPTVLYDEYYSSMRALFEGILPGFNTTIKSTEGIFDQLEIIQKRIFTSCHEYLAKQMEVSRLEAELRFLESVDSDEILSMPVVDEGLSTTVEASAALLQTISKEMEDVAQKFASETLEESRICVIENSVALNRKRLEMLEQIDSKLTQIFCNHVLYYLLLNREKTDIQSTDKFFRDVHSYIINDLYNYQLQVEAMQGVINDYKSYTKQPIEEKCKIIKLIDQVLTSNQDGRHDDMPVLEKVQHFTRQVDNVEYRAFVSDFKECFASSCKTRRKLDVPREFLSDGPTNHAVVVPHEVLRLIDQSTGLLKHQESTLNTAMQLLGETQKKLSSNKWLSKKRQLWMSFLVKPRQVQLSIEDIKAAVKEKRNLK